MSRSRRLVVIPSDPIEAYERAGYEGLDRYYNPRQRFDEVFALSPFEPGDREAHGMHIRRVAAAGFRDALAQIAPDVVRAYGGHWPADLVCRNRIPGVPVLVSAHDSSPAMLHRSVCYADLVLCVSQAVEDLARSRGVEPGRVRRLPNRVDLAVFRPVVDVAQLARVSRRFPAGRHILHVGRKSREKNIETVIAALALLPHDYSAVFVGQGDATPYAALAGRLGVSARCFWVEAVRNSELPAWYSWCDCMCTPSRWEGFGIVFIEAAACGAAIVTSDIPPMNDHLVHGVSAQLVSEYENPRALARAIQDVAEDQEYRRKLSAGAREAAKPFDRESIDAVEVGIYDEALQIKPRALSSTQRALLATDAACRKATRIPHAVARVGREWGEVIADAAELARDIFPRRRPSDAGGRSPAQAALAWLHANHLPAGGIRVHSRHGKGYPEVTGYLVPTLIEWNESELVGQLLRWLIDIQRFDGSYPDPDRGVPYLFDTGQALRGLLAGRGMAPAADDAARRAAEYLVTQMIDQGRGGFPRQFGWFQTIPVQETILLYVLPPLQAAAEAFERPDWKAAARQCLEYYLGHEQLLDMGRLTHFLAYELEALIDLGRADVAGPVLERLASLQREDGAVRAAGDAAWVCVPGLAQLAVCWYKLAQPQPADRAMAWLERQQRASGGFRGSVGKGATYFPRREIPWAVKYFLDADHLRARFSHV